MYVCILVNHNRHTASLYFLMKLKHYVNQHCILVWSWVFLAQKLSIQQCDWHNYQYEEVFLVNDNTDQCQGYATQSNLSSKSQDIWESYLSFVCACVCQSCSILIVCWVNFIFIHVWIIKYHKLHTQISSHKDETCCAQDPNEM